MSSANKSSFKSSNASTTGCYEDELLTWLQYPTDDVFERSYCSDVFQGGWQLAPTEGVTQSNPDVATLEQEISLSTSMGTSICETGSTLRESLVKKDMGMKTAVVSRSSCNVSAEDALAQGAARAAGHSLLEGQHGYTKVKTLMQPTVHTSTPSRTPYYSINDCKQVKNHPTKANFPISSVPSSALKSLQHAKRMKVNMLESPPFIESKHMISESSTSPSKRSRAEYEAHSHTHPTGSSHVTDQEATIDQVNMVVGSDRRCTVTSTSWSGASQSSMSLSGRETEHSGKHKQDDLELLTEDYAEDDSMDTKRRSKPPSKRNRVADVHNLSERNRRNRINEKLKALQDLIPNSSKTDKASVLDEAIEYMKTLQMQLQMVSMRNSLNVSTMMPMNRPEVHMQMGQPHSISLGVPIGHAAGMGMGLGLGIPQMGPSATTHLQYPAGMSQLHALPFHSGNMASFAHMGFLQNVQSSPAMQNMQESFKLSAKRRPCMYQHQQSCNPGHETVSIEHDDVSDG